MGPRSHTDAVLDHQAGQFFAVYQDDSLRTPCNMVPRCARECGRGDEQALGRARRLDRTREAAPVVLAHGVAVGIFLRLHVDFVQTECILPDRAADPAIARASCHTAHRGVTAAVAHRDKQIDDRPLKKR